MLISSRICVFIVLSSFLMKQSSSRPPRNYLNITQPVIPIISERIVFPESEETSDNFRFVPLASQPKCAEGSTFCEDIDTYPDDHLQYSLSRISLNRELFVIDEIPVENRVNEPGEHYLCDSIDRIIFPKVGKTKHNKWKYIINQGEKGQYAQGVRVEICRRPNRPCHLIERFPTGYIASCKQKYTYRRLFSFSDMGDQLQEVFEMPSACCCSYKMDLSAGFGKKFTPIG